MPAVDADLGVISTPQQRRFADVRKGFTSFRDNDVIVAKITPCFENGKMAVCRGLVSGLGFGSTEFHVLRETGAVLPEYVYHFVRQDRLRSEGESNMTGSVGQKRVPANWLSAVTLPVPPLAEQRRIVAKVEEVLDRAAAARERLTKLPKILKRFRQSVLAAACSGRLTADWREHHSQIEAVASSYARLRNQQVVEYDAAVAAARGRGERKPRKPAYLEVVEEDGIDLPTIPELPESWRLLRVQDAAVAMQYGTSVKADAPADTGVPMLRMSNVQDGRIDLSDLKFMDPGADDVESFLLHRGDVVFNRTNSPELVGKSGVFDVDRRVVFASYLVRLKCDQRLIQSDFVCNWINSLWGKAWARVVRTDGVSQSNINATKLGAMPLPVPPLEEQVVIGHRVRQMFELADKIEKRVLLGTVRAEKLVQATLAKAFRGKLVATEAELAVQEGRDYETAEALLARIKLGTAAPQPRSHPALLDVPTFRAVLFEEAEGREPADMQGIAGDLSVLRERWTTVAPATLKFDGALAEAFRTTCDRNSPDRVVADPELHHAFLEQCRKLGLENPEFDLCFSLLNMRKGNNLKGLDSARKPVMGQWRYAAASEIAARVIHWRHGLTVDRIICHPTIVEEFEQVARSITPGYSSFEYRWAALGCRKVGQKATPGVVERLRWSDPSSFAAVGELPDAKGVYALRDRRHEADYLFVYGSENIREGIAAQTNLGSQNLFGDGLWRPDPEHLVWTYAKTSAATAERYGIVNTLVSQWSPILNVLRAA